MNYYDTFIQVAPDCPVSQSVVPAATGARPSVHLLQYELLAQHPYTYTQEELLFEVHMRHKSIPESEREVARVAFFQKSQPCLRSSLLAKKYGWGLHFDREGKIALVTMESEEYRRLTQPGKQDVKLLTAFRSKRG